MYKLENYLDAQTKVSKDIYNDYKKFGYTDEILFKHHLDFMLTNLYDIEVVEPTKKRMGQQEFRKKIMEKYKHKCIITGETCTDELEAAHIIPVCTDESYDINNGLLLSVQLHKTFDKYKWTIDPKTLRVTINYDVNVGTISKYDGQIIKLQMNDELYNNLKEHYDIFITNL